MAIENKGLEATENLPELLSKAEAWILLHLDNDGIHLRSPNPGYGLMLIANLLSSDGEAWDIVKEEVERIKDITEKEKI